MTTDFGFGDLIEGRCTRCGSAVGPGEYPFCPHGRVDAAMIVRDEIPGGIVCENYGPEPIRFYSHSERRKYMAAHGLIEKERFSPMPGTDKDPAGIPNPAGYVDPQTLENARVLLSRGSVRDIPLTFDTGGVLVNHTVETIADAERMKDALGQRS